MKIPQRARQISPINVQVANPSLSTPNEKAFGTDISETLLNVTKATENIAKINYSMQDQRDEIALSTFKSNADLLSKAYVEDIKNVKDIKDIDLKKQQLDKEIEASAKNVVPDNIYNGWKAREGLVFNAELNYATERVRTEKNIDITKANVAKADLNYSNLRYQAKTPQQAEYYRQQYDNMLNKLVSGENQIGVKVFSQEEKDKLMFAFDNRYDTTQIQELIYGTPEDLLVTGGTKTKSNLGNPTQAIKDLDNAKMFKTFTPEERQKWKYEALKRQVELTGTTKDEVVKKIMEDFIPKIQKSDSQVYDNNPNVKLSKSDKETVYQYALNTYNLAVDDLASFANQEGITNTQAITVRDEMAKLVKDPKSINAQLENDKYQRAIVRVNEATLTKKDKKYSILNPQNATEKIARLLGGNNKNIKKIGDVITLSQDLVKTANELLDDDKRKDLLEKANLVGRIIVDNIKEDELKDSGDNRIEYQINDLLKQYYKDLKLETEEAVAKSETLQVYNKFIETHLEPIDYYNEKDIAKIEQYKNDFVNLVIKNEQRRQGGGKIGGVVIGGNIWQQTEEVIK